MFCLGLEPGFKNLADQTLLVGRGEVVGYHEIFYSVKDFTHDLFALTLLPKPLGHREVAR